MSRRRKMSRRIQQLLKWVKTLQFPKWVKTLLLPILIATFAGIVSSSVRDFIVTVWNWFVSHVIQQNLWPYGIFATVAIVITAILLYTRHDRDVKSHTLNMANKMLALDNAVFRMLPISTTNKPDEHKRILKEVLRHILMVFGGPVERAAILLPNPANPSSLKCWAHYHMTEEDVQSMQCDIGNTSQIQHNKGGIAGKAFLTGQILVAHLENGQWVCKVHTQLINFEETHPFTPYLSLVNVPISRSNPSTNTTANNIGVLHLESRSRDTFDPNDSNDSNAIETLLKELATRVAALIEDFQPTPTSKE